MDKNESMTMDEEILRIAKISDQGCSIHSALRDKYYRLSALFDVIVMLITVWLISLSFVDESFSLEITPFQIKPKIWTGMLAMVAFVLTLGPLLLRWREKCDLHGKAVEQYYSIKQQCKNISVKGCDSLQDAGRLIQNRYEIVNNNTIAIPERLYNKYKRKHLFKKAVNKNLSTNPGAWVSVIKIKLLIRDNWKVLQE